MESLFNCLLLDNAKISYFNVPFLCDLSHMPSWLDMISFPDWQRLKPAIMKNQKPQNNAPFLSADSPLGIINMGHGTIFIVKGPLTTYRSTRVIVFRKYFYLFFLCSYMGSVQTTLKQNLPVHLVLRAISSRTCIIKQHQKYNIKTHCKNASNLVA